MRKPAHVDLAGGKSARQRIWETARALGVFDLNQIRGELPGTFGRDRIRVYLQCLAAAGYLAPAVLDGRPGWRLVRDAGPEAPRVREDGSEVTQGRAQEQLWRTLRMLGGEHTAEQWALHASLPEIPVSRAGAADYLAWLARAGYLQKSGRGGAAKYRLIPVQYSGPKPPMIQRIKQVFDPNLGRVVWSGGDHD